MKISVFGIGGIGGVIGGALAKVASEEISLLARGDRCEHIAKSGLTVHSDFIGDFTVKAGAIADTALEIGKTGVGGTVAVEDLGIQDIVIVCVKTTAIESAVKTIKPLVDSKTLIVPAMNGLSGAEEFRKAFPNNPVAATVLYVVAFAEKDFSVTQQGSFIKVVLDDLAEDEKAHEKVAMLSELLNKAGITGRLSSNIRKEMWNKYAFNCAFNTMTAALACNARTLKEETNFEDFKRIIGEVVATAKAEGVELPEDTVEVQSDRLLHTKGDSDSSLSRDFAVGKVGEMEMFSGDLIRRAEQFDLRLPTMEKYYGMLKELAEKM